ncbi:hypothetical protein MSAN_01153000 [Mycena sanguinolenta]|uniref:Uncharacterized protein n=1 Tax=Mycena sanguinolenta TaxID=230812 RepID=A0A8H7D3V1_9AGAR|nr:hypothetical protein MSAN_01153000 [Mycena sanguinolenta]
MSAAQELRWIIAEVNNPNGFSISFSDGQPVDVERGGSGVSCRLIVQTQGFLDITSLSCLDFSVSILDFNGIRWVWKASSECALPFQFCLSFPGDGKVDVSAVLCSSSSSEPARTLPVTLKPLPAISDADVEYIASMIAQKYIPYRQIPDEPGRTDEEIREIGLRLFPWSPHSYELAMCVYDYTTASFARMVFMKVFQYTSIPKNPLPLDLESISLMIWESDWDTYNPQDEDFMNSFMMKPAKTHDKVTSQLQRVHVELQRFSDIQNRVISAVLPSLPRTPIVSKPYLFSGQVDIFQMGMNRFGIEILQFPGNAGPVGRVLEVEFATAVGSFIKPSSIITTKMFWSFADSEADARHYSNGILMVVQPPADTASVVWDDMAYITELSDGPTKTEFLFPPGSSFRVLSVEPGDGLQVVRLEVVPREGVEEWVLVFGESQAPHDAVYTAITDEAAVLSAEADSAVVHSVRSLIPALDQVPCGEPPTIDHVHAKKTNGRWCRCVERHQASRVDV